MRPMQKRNEFTSVMNFDALNVVIPSNAKNSQNTTRKDHNILRICSKKGCGENNIDQEKRQQLIREKYLNTVKALAELKDVLHEKVDSNELKICPCSESKNKKDCRCNALRAAQHDPCDCDDFDYLCKIRCIEYEYEKDMVNCGCPHYNHRCLKKCFKKQNAMAQSSHIARCGCSKTDKDCQKKCLYRFFNLSLRSFLRCSCGKNDRICQDRCLSNDDSALKSFLRCGCGKTDRMCKERCLQSDTAAIRNHLRCGCNVTEFSCLDRCARDQFLEHDWKALDCGCNLNDYACKVRCDTTTNGWRKPNNQICKCENFDHECKQRCARHKTEKDSFDNLISHVANNGKKYKISNDIDVVVYDPMNLAHILDGMKFNNDKIRDNQGQHILPVLKFDNNDISNKGVQAVGKPDTNIDSNELTNKGKNQEIDQVLKELQDAKMVEFDIGNVQTEHNGKFQSPKPTKFIDMLLEFATKIKNATSTKLSKNVHPKATIGNKNIKQGHYGISSGTKEYGKKKASNFEDLSLQEPKNEKYPQKQVDGALDPLYKIFQSGPDRDVESGNENREGGMHLANDVVESLQSYLYARRRGREKRRKDDDHDPHHPHQKHRLLPLTKRQKMKRLNWQVGRSLVKFRRNSPSNKVVTYGVPFELDIKGMGQVNFVEAIQLLNA